MKFRIKHLLLATAIVAAFAYGLSFPSYYVARWFRFGAWAAAALLTARAVSRPAERKAIACGLVVAASYLAVLEYHKQDTPLPTSAVLERIYPELVPIDTAAAQAIPGTFTTMVNGRTYRSNPHADEFRAIGEYGFATIFGLIAAGLVAYWSNESTNLKEAKP